MYKFIEKQSSTLLSNEKIFGNIFQSCFTTERFPSEANFNNKNKTTTNKENLVECGHHKTFFYIMEP